ncbi:MAG: hypothetical protein NVS2B17_04550 [Candidatus Velthaea sp.]
MFRFIFAVIGWFISRLFFRRNGYGGYFGGPYGRGYGGPPGPTGYGPMLGRPGYNRGGGFMSGLLGGLGGAFLGNELFNERREDGGFTGSDGAWGGGDVGGGGDADGGW